MFGLFASSIYVLNDLVDLSADRRHPRKRFRPFASGVLPANYGIILLLGLLALASVIAVVMVPAILLLMLLYVLVNLAYSTKLKQVAALDIMTLSGLYCLRIWVGGVATGIGISFWLIVFAFFLSLAAIKRQAELVDIKTRGVADIAGRGYTVNNLPFMTMGGLGGWLSSGFGLGLLYLLTRSHCVVQYAIGLARGLFDPDLLVDPLGVDHQSWRHDG